MSYQSISSAVLVMIFSLASECFGQINLNVHLNNAPAVSVDMNEVDSLYYTTSGAQPTVVTVEPSGISPFAAVIDGEVTTDSTLICSDRGICWSTSPDPTTQDNISSVGFGYGSFSALVSGLAQTSTYFAKAYITTALGTEYGNEITFTTLEALYTPGGGVTDIEGNVYPTIIIDTQEWMAQNLRVRYRPIPNPITGDTIGLSDNFWGPLLYDTTAYFYDVGMFYDWDLVEDTFNLCPVGWHVPSDAEWNTLRDYLNPTAGGMMKRITLTTDEPGNWYQPNVGATNQSGFSAIPTGYWLGSTSLFGSWSGSVFAETEWWSTDRSFSFPYEYKHTRKLRADTQILQNSDVLDAGLNELHPVRCIKD